MIAVINYDRVEHPGWIVGKLEVDRLMGGRCGHETLGPYRNRPGTRAFTLKRAFHPGARGQLDTETALLPFERIKDALRFVDRRRNQTSWTMSWTSIAIPSARKRDAVYDTTSVV